jgi:predicted ATPase
VGKTRLAQSLARAEGDAVWFCDLSDAGDLIGLCATVAYRLGVVLDGDPVRCVGRWLARRGAALLVLDNFEQLAHFASSVIGRLLDDAPELRIVVTSRERLRLPDEVCFELAPLPLPREASELQGCASFELLLARLRAIDPSFELQDGDASRMVALLATLEGLPLAIELAAPRVALLGVAGLLERLQRSLDALDDAPRGSPLRQTSLRESMRWSFDLLGPEERRALAYCSLFRGGFAAEAAETLFGERGVDRLRALRDASLLRTLRPGRFALYESVREFAAERLDELGERIAASQAHAALTVERCMRLAAAAEEHGEPLAALHEERWNLEQALRWSVAAGERERAVQAVLALSPLLSSQGPLAHLLDALGLVLAVAPSDPRALHARGKALLALGRLNEAERDLRAAADGAEQRESTAQAWPGLRARICKDLGVLHHQRRDVAEARRCYEQALTLASAGGERGEQRLRGLCVGNLGALCHDTGDFEAAAERYENALAIVRAAGDLRTEGVFLTNLAVLHQELGRRDRARRDYLRAIELLRGIGDLRGEGVAIENLAVLEHLDGNLEESRAHHERARALLETVGDERSEGLCRARLAAVLAQLGERHEARVQLERSAALFAERDDAIARGVLDLHRGFLELAEGDRVAAMARLRAVRASAAGPALVAVSDDARAAATALEAWLAMATRTRLGVGAEAQWFQVGDAPAQSLASRPTHARLLAHLCELHATAPERSASLDELFAAGWSGQSATPESAANRVHVALAQLRKLGLGAPLEHTATGHRLDPRWLVLRRTGAAPSSAENAGDADD